MVDVLTISIDDVKYSKMSVEDIGKLASACDAYFQNPTRDKDYIRDIWKRCEFTSPSPFRDVYNAVVVHPTTDVRFTLNGLLSSMCWAVRIFQHPHNAQYDPRALYCADDLKCITEILSENKTDEKE